MSVGEDWEAVKRRYGAVPAGDEPTEVSAGKTMAIWAAVILGGFILIIIVLGSFVSITRTGPNEVAVVRNGGWLDDKSIRTIIAPTSGYQVPGLYSDVHKYIAGNSQRYYTVTADPNRGDRTGEDYVEVPTKDGVQVRLEGTLFFHTAFTDPSGQNVDKPLLEKFDTEYGVRTFEGSHPYDGNDGWQKFLDVVLRPVLDNTIRQEIGQFNCADLVSSCALIQSHGQVDLTQVNGAENTKNFEAVQTAIQQQLETGINSALGAEYLTNIQFRLAAVRLPSNVQQSIDNAQASFADIAKAEAEQKQSQFEAQRLSNLAEQYAKSPQLAFLDAVKAAPSGATVIIGSQGFVSQAGSGK